ncbi:AIPR family protein [Bacillus cereus]|uniref:AIPR family protein n=1 Tax=Bacillus cereus TaxID=1396 RepID=UPI0021D64EDC|nr:AIPR family protein [Bacillus cereus]MCU7757200.1 AIPR family protein [Bacillus cereus]MDC7753027.1 AIPR family protein [Bacillus cereus]
MKSNNVVSMKFKVRNVRRMPNPFGEMVDNSQKSPEMYEVLVDVKDVPKDINLKTNPRLQNMKTKTVTKIREGLMTDNKVFHILNRGIVISVKDVKFDNMNSEITILLEDMDVHGNIDGGHTYQVILQNRDKMKHRQFVKMEFLTGIESIFEDVAAARNTSVQVQDKAIAELKKKFEFIKEFIEGQSFEDNIAYKENDDKDIDVRELISILYMFNISKYPGRQSMPTKAFNSPHNCVKDFIESFDEGEAAKQLTNPYYKMKNIIVDIFKLYDEIERTMAENYKGFFGAGTKYGSVKGVTCVNTKTKFYGNAIEYRTPKGFIYPILGSFRSLLEEKDGFYKWKSDPFLQFNEVGKDLVGETVERSRSLGNNPGSVGKDSGHWKQLYQNVLTNYLLSDQD